MTAKQNIGGYTSPEIIELGTVSTLTQGQGSGDPDGNSGSRGNNSETQFEGNDADNGN